MKIVKRIMVMMSSKPIFFWKTVCLFMSDNGKDRDKIIFKEGDIVIANTKDVCNVFNEYFINTANDILTILIYKDH